MNNIHDKGQFQESPQRDMRNQDYPQQPYNQRRPYPNTKFFRNVKGEVLKTIAQGYDIHSGIQMVAVRNMNTYDTLFMPAAELRGKTMQDGSLVWNYIRLYDYTEEDFYAEKRASQQSQTTTTTTTPDPVWNGQRDRAYPGYTDDARLDRVQRFNARYGR